MKLDTDKKAYLENVQNIKTSELRYRRLFEAAQDGILLLDAETGMIMDVNPFLVKMLGYTREEFVEKRLWEVGAFQDVEASQEAFKALQRNEYIRYEDDGFQYFCVYFVAISHLAPLFGLVTLSVPYG